MNDISGQLDREKTFHDKWSSEIDLNKINVETAMEGSTAPENRFFLKNIGNLENKYILDLGCGAGEASVYFAKQGAQCVASDYTPGMVKTAQNLAEMHKVKLEGKIINAEAIDFPDNVFDIVYASSILHHVNYSKTLLEIHRILKPNGLTCIAEPLKHNPLINIYRMIARKVRTEDERPLDIKVVDQIKTLFSEVKYDTFWFATLWILIRFFLIERINPNKERYWKKIIYEEPRLRRSYLQLEKLDTYFKKIPFFKRYGWVLAVIATK